MREPPFWRNRNAPAARLLAPAAEIYGAWTGWQMRRPGARAGVPVICVGNFTHGGAGKTPAAIAIARLLIERGERPVFLSRGYGGALQGPVRVEPQHRSADVGDEAQLLARVAPAIVGHDRVAGARAAIDLGATVIVMDDGMQNPTLAKDLTIAVVDTGRGLGNGRVFPAGPLRAPLDAQLACAEAILLVGDALDNIEELSNAACMRGLPLIRARITPDAGAAAALAASTVLAFAGIGDPEKFFASLRSAGIRIGAKESFPDHHRFTARDAERLLARCDKEGLVPVTTEKDFVRLQGEPELAQLTARTRVLPVSLSFEDRDETAVWIARAIKRGQGDGGAARPRGRHRPPEARRSSI